jgi:hypothetical protein
MNNDKIILACFIMVAIVFVAAIFALPVLSTAVLKLALSGIVFFCVADYIGIV